MGRNNKRVILEFSIKRREQMSKYNHKEDPPLYPVTEEGESFDFKELSKRIYEWELKMKEYQKEHPNQKIYRITSDNSDDVEWTKFNKFDIMDI